MHPQKTCRVRVELACKARARTGESPLWSPGAQALYFVDILGGEVFRWNPENNRREQWSVGEQIGCIAETPDGSLLIAGHYGLKLLDPQNGDIADIGRTLTFESWMRFNDGITDIRGRLWAGTTRVVSQRPAPVGCLFRIGRDYSASRVARGLWQLNGLAFSPDYRELYYSDMHLNSQCVWRCPVDIDTGQVGHREMFFDFGSLAGRPDGAAMDEDGCYWVAGYDGWEIYRLTPKGALDLRIPVPVQKPTNLAFGGSNYDQLYITSAGDRISPGSRHEQPHAGSVFVCQPGVRGIPMPAFRLNHHS